MILCYSINEDYHDHWLISLLSCVIAELFLEGTPIFSLSQLFKYRNGEYDPSVYLDKIEDTDIRVCKNMLFIRIKHTIMYDSKFLIDLP